VLTRLLAPASADKAVWIWFVEDGKLEKKIKGYYLCLSILLSSIHP